MAAIRTVPFGYRMTGGKIEYHPLEKNAVAEIYKSYLEGKSYQKIAEQVMAKNIAYHESTPIWNKNMVKRILENHIYFGGEKYPPIITAEDYDAVKAAKSHKTAGWGQQSKCMELATSKAVCGRCGGAFRKTSQNENKNRWWHCKNENCANVIKIKDAQMENEIVRILNRVITEPELMQIEDQAEPRPSMESIRLTNEIGRELNKSDFDEERISALVMACAAEKYKVCASSCGHAQLQEWGKKLKKFSPADHFNEMLFKAIVEAVVILQDGVIALRLINGRIVTN